MLVGSLKDDQGEVPRSWIHTISTQSRQLEWLMLNYFHANCPPTLIGLFSVVRGFWHFSTLDDDVHGSQCGERVI